MAIERSIRINVEAGRAKAELRSLQGSLRDTDRAAGAAATASRALGAAIAGFASVATIRQVASYADTYTNLQNQLRLVTNSTEQLASSTDALFSIAQRTRNSFEGTADLYARLARSTEDLGISNDRLLSVTETVNQAIAVSGTTAASAQAALFQLGQGLGAGALRGEELNSVLEQTPRLAKAIADGLGITIAELRELGSQGELTAQRVIGALESQAKVLDREYGQTASTIEQAFTKINNELIKYVGEADKANGITKTITGTLNSFAENFEEIADTVAGVAVPAFTALAAVIAGRLAGAIAASTKAAASNIAVTLAQNKAIVQNAAFEADRAAALQLTTFATLNKVKTEEASTLVALNNIKAVQAQLIAERELEVVRLKAQITDIGRTQSLARLAEIRLAEAATTAQVTAAETALAAAKSKTTLAYNTFTAASAAAIAATTAHARALKASTLAANAGAAATGAFRNALALIGGPAGAALIASFAVFKLAQATDSYRKEAERTERATDDLAESFKKLGREQLNQARTEAVANLAKLRQEQESLSVATREASGAISRENTILGGLGGQLAKSAQNYDKNTEARIKNNAQVAAAEAALKALNNELGINSDATDENAKNADLVSAAYKKLKGELDSATKIQLDYEESVSKINKQLPEGEKRTELLRLAEKKRDADLARLNERTRKAEERNAKLHRSYTDLRGEFDPLAKISFEYQEILKEIDQSTASVSEKETLRALAAKQLRENLDDAIVTSQEFLAQFDSIAAAEVRRIDLLKQLEKVQASASEKQALAAEIQRQYNKELDDAIPSFTELNAQFSAADAATVAYVDTLKQLDEAQRLGVDVTELRINALKSYQKAAEEGRKQDILNAETNQSFLGAFKQGLMDTALTADSSFDQIREVGRNAIGGLADQITQFISTGEADFRSFASSVIAELLKIQTQALITQAFTSFAGGGATAARGAAFDGGVQKFARGGASMPLSAFSGSVVSTPTKFAAGGTVGQMGEAGAEAILPLQKTASGDLGVSAAGMAAPTQPNVNVDVPVQVINVTERPQDYLTSDAGVRQIINIVNQNRDAIA